MLDAEHAARDAVAQAGEAAAAMTEDARAASRALAARTERRIRSIRAAFEARTARTWRRSMPPRPMPACRTSSRRRSARGSTPPWRPRRGAHRAGVLAAMGSIEYAQARLSARYGQRPDELAWRRIEHVRSFAGTARRRPRHRRCGSGWRGSARPARAHEIEALLRGQWRALVADVAGWMPDAWQAAVRWCAVAADLPVVAASRAGRRHAAVDAGRPGVPRAVRARRRRGSARRPTAARSRRSRRRGPNPAASATSGATSGAARMPARHGDDPRLVDELGARDEPRISPPSTIRRSRDGWPLRRDAAGAPRAAVPPRDARSRGGFRLPRARRARPRAPARRAPAARRVSRADLAASTAHDPPTPARWFEILAARDDATLALEALATTGAVELEARPTAVLPAALADLRPQLAEFAELSLRYHAYWPQTRHTTSPFPEPPAATLARSLAHLRAWAEEAEPVIQQLQRSRSRARRAAAVAPGAGDDRRQRHRLRAARRRRAGAARAAVRVSARQRARAAARDADAHRRSRRHDGVRAVRADGRRGRRRAGARAAGGAAQGPRVRRAGVAQGRCRGDGALHRAAPRRARPRGAAAARASSRRCTPRHDLHTRAGRRRTACSG